MIAVKMVFVRFWDANNKSFFGVAGWAAIQVYVPDRRRHACQCVRHGLLSSQREQTMLVKLVTVHVVTNQNTN